MTFPLSGNSFTLLYIRDVGMGCNDAISSCCQPDFPTVALARTTVLRMCVWLGLFYSPGLGYIFLLSWVIKDFNLKTTSLVQPIHFLMKENAQREAIICQRLLTEYW